MGDGCSKMVSGMEDYWGEKCDTTGVGPGIPSQFFMVK